MPLTAKYMCRLLPCTCPRRCHATQSPPSAPDVHNPNRKGIKLDPDISRVGGKWFVRCRRVRSGPSRCRCPGCGNGASRCRSRYRAADADTAGEDAGQAEPHRLSERCGSEVLVVGSQLVRLACAQKKRTTPFAPRQATPKKSSNRWFGARGDGRDAPERIQGRFRSSKRCDRNHFSLGWHYAWCCDARGKSISRS
jgi:hypothetical protein